MLKIIGVISQYKWYIIIPIILIILISFIIKFRKKIYEFMVDAETGALTYHSLSVSIDKIQKSDLDDRMIAVIANLITSFPILKLLPQKWVVSFLNKIVQKSFDSMKAMLDAKAEAILKKVNKDKVNNVDEIVNDLVEKLVVLVKYKDLNSKLTVNNVTNILKENNIAEELGINEDAYINAIDNKINDIASEFRIPEMPVETLEENLNLATDIKDDVASLFVR